MKKTLLTLLSCLIVSVSFADDILIETFEYANHDMTVPVGWESPDESWLCGYMDKDHNRTAHTGNWYAFTNADDSYMSMPFTLSSQLKYRFKFWAISDGTYELQILGGHESTTTTLCSTTVSGGEYQYYSFYVTSIPTNFEYFAIRAIAEEGAYYLTIDDFVIEMVPKYGIEVSPHTFDTVLYAGSRVTIGYKVQNTGYEPLEIYMTPYSEFFTDVTFTADGVNTSTFHTEPQQIVQCTCTATLSPSIAPDTYCWLDITLTVSCDCTSAMFTLWTTVLDPAAGIPENENIDDVYSIEVFDLTGKKVDPANLKAGIYIERTVSSKGVSTRKFVKQ